MRRFFNKFGEYFIYGLLTLLPLMVTFGILGWFGFQINALFGADSAIGHVLRIISDKLHFSHYAILFISYFSAFCFIALFGYVVRRFAKLRFQEKSKHMMEHFPVLSTIYNTVEQVVGFITKKDKALGKFGEVVIIKYANLMALGLLASRQSCMIDGRPCVVVFFPSSPMPATGFNFLVPVDDVYLCHLNFEQLSKILFSLGALGPQVLCEELHAEKLGDALLQQGKMAQNDVSL